jgi:hypothetical protein
MKSYSLTASAPSEPSAWPLSHCNQSLTADVHKLNQKLDLFPSLQRIAQLSESNSALIRRWQSLHQSIITNNQQLA